MHCPPTWPRRCAAAPLAKPGDPTVSRVLRWAQVGKRRRGWGAETRPCPFPATFHLHRTSFEAKLIFFSFFLSEMNLCSFFLWCSVAFSKICPAGKGYFFENRREIFAFPPIIYPRKLDKDGESLNGVTCKALCKSHFLTIIAFLLISETKRPVRHCSFFPSWLSFVVLL